MLRVFIQLWRLVQVTITKTDKNGLPKGRDRLFYKFWTMKSGRFIKGGCFIQGRNIQGYLYLLSKILNSSLRFG